MNSAGHVRIRPESGRILGREQTQKIQFPLAIRPAIRPRFRPDCLAGFQAECNWPDFQFFLRQSGLQSGQFLAGFLAGFATVHPRQKFFRFRLKSYRSEIHSNHSQAYIYIGNQHLQAKWRTSDLISSYQYI